MGTTEVRKAVGRCLEKIQAKDPVTYGHSMRVGSLVTEFYERKGTEPYLLESISAGAYLHDIGKLYEKDSILNNPGRLEENQRKEMMKHPGYGILFLPEGLKGDKVIHDCILQHHESFDPEKAAGYPFNLKGNDISEYAQTVAVADVFDACLNKRQYKEEMSLDEVLEIINSDGKLNPGIAREFTDMIREKVVYREITGDDDPLKRLKESYIKEKEGRNMGVLTRIEEKIKEFRVRFEPEGQEAGKISDYEGKVGEAIDLTPDDLKIAVEQTKRELDALQEAQKAMLDRAIETGIFTKAISNSYDKLSTRIFDKTREYHNYSTMYNAAKPSPGEAVKEKVNYLARASIDKVLAGIGSLRQMRDDLQAGIKEARESVHLNTDLTKKSLGTKILAGAENINRKYLATVYAINAKSLEKVEKRIERLEEKYQHRASVRDSIKNVFNAITGREQIDISKAEISKGQQDKLAYLRQVANELKGENHNLTNEFNHSKERSMNMARDARDSFNAVGRDAEGKEFDEMVKKVVEQGIDRNRELDEPQKDGMDLDKDQDIGDDL